MDDYDDTEDASTGPTRNFLPHRAILFIMHEVGIDHFNNILTLFNVNVKVKERNDKYYLTIGSEEDVYWYNYDYIFGDEYLVKANSVAVEYHIGEYEGDIIQKSKWDDTTKKWVDEEFDDTSTDYTMECVSDILDDLYTNVDRSSDRARLMGKRFEELRGTLLDLGNDNLMSYLITFGKISKNEELETFVEYIKELNEGFDTAFYE